MVFGLLMSWDLNLILIGCSNPMGKRLILLGGGNSNMFCFLFSPHFPGEMIQFDEHIFQMG